MAIERESCFLAARVSAEAGEAQMVLIQTRERIIVEQDFTLELPMQVATLMVFRTLGLLCYTTSSQSIRRPFSRCGRALLAKRITSPKFAARGTPPRSRANPLLARYTMERERDVHREFLHSLGLASK